MNLEKEHHLELDLLEVESVDHPTQRLKLPEDIAFEDEDNSSSIGGTRVSPTKLNFNPASAEGLIGGTLLDVGSGDELDEIER